MFRERFKLIGKKRSRFDKLKQEIEKITTEDEKNSDMYYLKDEEGEKIILFKNRVKFYFTGRGKVSLIFGCVNIMGYMFENLEEEFEFDINKQFDKYSCFNKGLYLDDPEQKIKNLKMTDMRNISIIKFTDLQNFEIRKIISEIDIIDIAKYDQIKIENIIRRDNFVVSVSGKKNSGKSTFLLFLINRLLSEFPDNELYILDCDSQPLLSSPFFMTLLKVKRPLFHNYYKEDISVEIIRSKYISDNFEQTMKLFSELYKLYNDQKGSKALIINTNNNITGLGCISNIAILEISKPNINFFVKNKKKGGNDKGEEFEKYVMKDEEEHHLDIVLRPYRSKFIADNKHGNITFETQKVLIENCFDLKEINTNTNKNYNKRLYIQSNIIGDNVDFTFSNVLINHKLLNFDLESMLIEIPIDNTAFSLGLTDYTDLTDLDIFMSINAKICLVFKNERSEYIESDELCLNMVNEIHEDFISFCYVYNIDIINRKLILLTKHGKQIDSNIIILRDDRVDKYIDSKNEFEISKFIMTNKYTDEIPYYTRNKYNINA
jgi:polynucleotide 5'-kinase involved in rRNA processing